MLYYIDVNKNIDGQISEFYPSLIFKNGCCVAELDPEHVNKLKYFLISCYGDEIEFGEFMYLKMSDKIERFEDYTLREAIKQLNELKPILKKKLHEKLLQEVL